MLSKDTALACFIHGTKFSQSDHREDYHDFIFHKVNKMASESSYKTLKLWEIHDYIFTNVSIIHETHENFVP